MTTVTTTKKIETVKAQFKAAVDTYRANFAKTAPDKREALLEVLRKAESTCYKALSALDLGLDVIQEFVQETLGSVSLKKAMIPAKKTTAKASPKSLKIARIGSGEPAKEEKPAPAAKPAPATKDDPAKQDTSVRKSSIESPVQIVWKLAREMKNARRKDVIAAAVAQGVATNTARTQYQCWFKAEHGK